MVILVRVRVRVRRKEPGSRQRKEKQMEQSACMESDGMQCFNTAATGDTH